MEMMQKSILDCSLWNPQLCTYMLEYRDMEKYGGISVQKKRGRGRERQMLNQCCGSFIDFCMFVLLWVDKVTTHTWEQVSLFFSVHTYTLPYKQPYTIRKKKYFGVPPQSVWLQRLLCDTRLRCSLTFMHFDRIFAHFLFFPFLRLRKQFLQYDASVL